MFNMYRNYHQSSAPKRIKYRRIDEYDYPAKLVLQDHSVRSKLANDLAAAPSGMDWHHAACNLQKYSPSVQLYGNDISLAEKQGLMAAVEWFISFVEKKNVSVGMLLDTLYPNDRTIRMILDAIKQPSNCQDTTKQVRKAIAPEPSHPVVSKLQSEDKRTQLAAPVSWLQSHLDANQKQPKFQFEDEKLLPPAPSPQQNADKKEEPKLYRDAVQYNALLTRQIESALAAAPRGAGNWRDVAEILADDHPGIGQQIGIWCTLGDTKAAETLLSDWNGRAGTTVVRLLEVLQEVGNDVAAKLVAPLEPRLEAVQRYLAAERAKNPPPKTQPLKPLQPGGASNYRDVVTPRQATKIARELSVAPRGFGNWRDVADIFARHHKWASNEIPLLQQLHNPLDAAERLLASWKGCAGSTLKNLYDVVREAGNHSVAEILLSIDPSIDPGQHAVQVGLVEPGGSPPKRVKNAHEPPVAKGDDDGNCIICMESKRTYLLLECGHFSFCDACNEAYKKTQCPTCNQPITRRVRVYG